MLNQFSHHNAFQFKSVQTSAEATWLAMVKIRLSVISQGGSTLFWKNTQRFSLRSTLGQKHLYFLKLEVLYRAVYLSAPPQVAEQVPVFQLLHHGDQRSSEGDHTEQFWQERMGSQLGQERCEAQEAVSLGGIGRICGG